MDPNAALEIILNNARVLLEHDDAHGAEEMATCVLALDEWIRKGGFLPTAWAPKGKPN